MDDDRLRTQVRTAARASDPAERLARLAAGGRQHAVLRALSSLQDGQFATRQAVALGLTSNAVRWLARSGRTSSPRRGVWRWATAAGTADVAVTAWLTCWPAGVISHRSAAHHHGLASGGAPPSPEITVAHGGPTRAPAGLRVHVSRDLPTTDRLLVGAVTYTSLARTVCDLATATDAAATLTRVDDAIALGAAPRWIHRRASALAVGRDGVALVREATSPEGAATFRSWLERTSAELFLAAGLPTPSWNVPVRDRRGRIGVVDASWTDHGVVVELEGLRFHTTPRQRRRDAEQTVEPLGAGLVVRRFTWHDVVERPAEVVATVATALEAAGADVDVALVSARLSSSTRAPVAVRR